MAFMLEPTTKSPRDAVGRLKRSPRVDRAVMKRVNVLETTRLDVTAVIVTLNPAAVVGVPDSTPVVELRLRPPGSPVAAQTYEPAGAAVKLNEYGSPTKAFGSRLGFVI